MGVRAGQGLHRRTTMSLAEFEKKKNRLIARDDSQRCSKNSMKG